MSSSHQALSAWISLAEWLIANAGKDALGQGIAKIVPILRQRIDESRAELSRLQRNCDIGTADEHEYRTALLATMRRIADALDEIAGTLAAAWNETKEESGAQ